MSLELITMRIASHSFKFVTNLVPELLNVGYGIDENRRHNGGTVKK